MVRAIGTITRYSNIILLLPHLIWPSEYIIDRSSRSRREFNSGNPIIVVLSFICMCMATIAGKVRKAIEHFSFVSRFPCCIVTSNADRRSVSKCNWPSIRYTPISSPFRLQSHPEFRVWSPPVSVERKKLCRVIV